MAGFGLLFRGALFALVTLTGAVSLSATADPEAKIVSVCSFILDVRHVDVPAGVTQEEGHTRFLIHLPSAVLALIFLARRIQLLFLSLVGREIEFCEYSSCIRFFFRSSSQCTVCSVQICVVYTLAVT